MAYKIKIEYPGEAYKGVHLCRRWYSTEFTPNPHTPQEEIILKSQWSNGLIFKYKEGIINPGKL